MVEAEVSSVAMACDVVGLERSSWYSVAQRKPKPDDVLIAAFLRQCVEKRPRRGFWKCYTLARRKGFVWNHKRVYRVYKQIGLHLRRRVRYRPPAAVKQPMATPVAPSLVWAMDFMRDTLMSGQIFRTFNLIDEFNREALAIEIDLSMPAERVIRVLDQVKAWRPLPRMIRVDNGPEFVADALAVWAKNNDVLLHFIPKGRPQSNSLIERFNRSFREDILDCYLFESLDEVRDAAWEWLLEYNEERPHDSLDDMTPLEYRRKYESQRAEVSTN